MRVLLLNSPRISRREDIFEMEGGFPRIGIASIAAYLMENGVDKVEIIDPEVNKLSLEEIKDEIKKLRPDLVGIPAYTEEVDDAAEIAGAIKEVSPDTLTIAGGPHVSAIPAQALQEYESFDVCVYGEGELTMLDIAKGVPIEKVKGIAYKKDGKIVMNQPRPLIKDLNSIPPPAWRLYDLDLYRGRTVSSGFQKRDKKFLELPVEGARGCPFSCIFCFKVTGQTIRFKSPTRVVDEIEQNVDEFHANGISFVEGTFGVNRKIAISVCDEIIRRGLHERISWHAGPRVDTVDRELLEKMRKAGCTFIGFGVESGDPEMLKIIGKNITLEQIMEAFKVCREVGIKTEADFILGYPYETERTVLKTIGFAKKLAPYADYANFAILVPFPGTRVYKMAYNNIGGLKAKTKDWRMFGKQLGGALELQQLPTEKLIRLQARAYREFYLRLDKIPQLMRRLTFKRIVHGLKRIT